MKKELCQCDTCRLFRSKGIKAKFTEKECRELSEYAHRMMSQIREPKKK